MLFNSILLLFFIPVGLRIGRLDGNVHYLHSGKRKRQGRAQEQGQGQEQRRERRRGGACARRLRSWVCDWSRDHSLLRSTALIKTDTLVDGAVTTSKVVLALALTVADETDLSMALLSALSALGIVVLFFWVQPHARPSANYVAAGLWCGLLHTSLCAVYASATGTFPWAVYLSLLPIVAIGGGVADYFSYKYGLMSACARALVGRCGAAKSSRCCQALVRRRSRPFNESVRMVEDSIRARMGALGKAVAANNNDDGDNLQAPDADNDDDGDDSGAGDDDV